MVATPIGNLRDITLRALDVLSAADLILAEDTRVAGKLMAAYGLKAAKLERYDEHGAERTRPLAMAALALGKPGGPGLQTPAPRWSPTLAPPGERKPPRKAIRSSRSQGPPPCWRACRRRACPPTASCSRAFHRRKPRRSGPSWRSSRPARATLVFFEGSSRHDTSLADMAAVLGAREAVVRPRTFPPNSTRNPLSRPALAVLAADPKLDAPKGEIVILVGPGAEVEATAADADTALADALKRLKPADAAAEVARALGLNRRDLYRRAMELKTRPDD